MDLPKESFEIEDIAVFDVLNSTFRLRVLRALSEPRSVKELAEKLGVPVTRLYYHINQMAATGVITVVEERKVGAILEKIYQTTAKTYTVSEKLLAAGHDPAELARMTAAVVLDRARVDAESALTVHFARENDLETLPGAITRSHVSMTPERARDFTERLQKLIDEMSENDAVDDATEYAFTVVFLPLTEYHA